MKSLRIVLMVFFTLFLVGCGQFVVEVNLTPEQWAEQEAIILKYTEKLKNWDPSNPFDPEEDINPPLIQEIEGGTIEFEESDKPDPRPPFQYFFKIAMAQEKLGYLSDSLDTYEKGMRLYENSQVAWNNMGRLLERMERYDEAITYYQKILDQFGFTQYWLDIAMAYVRKGDPEAAQKAYDQYRIITNQTDVGLERQIQALRQNNNP